LLRKLKSTLSVVPIKFVDGFVPELPINFQPFVKDSQPLSVYPSKSTLVYLIIPSTKFVVVVPIFMAPFTSSFSVGFITSMPRLPPPTAPFTDFP